MDDLSAFLRARFDEDEQTARKAASLCGCHPPAPSWLFGDESTDGRILVADDPHPETKRKLKRRWNGSYDGLFTAEHVARFDPARVLHEVDAKRRIIDLHRAVPYRQYDPPHFVCYECSSRDDDHFHVADAPCETLRLLALPYASHFEYRAEWRP